MHTRDSLAAARERERERERVPVGSIEVTCLGRLADYVFSFKNTDMYIQASHCLVACQRGAFSCFLTFRVVKCFLRDSAVGTGRGSSADELGEAQ